MEQNVTDVAQKAMNKVALMEIAQPGLEKGVFVRSNVDYVKTSVSTVMPTDASEATILLRNYEIAPARKHQEAQMQNLFLSILQKHLGIKQIELRILPNSIEIHLPGPLHAAEIARRYKLYLNATKIREARQLSNDEAPQKVLEIFQTAALNIIIPRSLQEQEVVRVNQQRARVSTQVLSSAGMDISLEFLGVSMASRDEKKRALVQRVQRFSAAFGAKLVNVKPNWGSIEFGFQVSDFRTSYGMYVRALRGKSDNPLAHAYASKIHQIETEQIPASRLG